MSERVKAVCSWCDVTNTASGFDRDAAIKRLERWGWRWRHGFRACPECVAAEQRGEKSLRPGNRRQGPEIRAEHAGQGVLL